jgi:hypothetical protein
MERIASAATLLMPVATNTHIIVGTEYGMIYVHIKGVKRVNNWQMTCSKSNFEDDVEKFTGASYGGFERKHF